MDDKAFVTRLNEIAKQSDVKLPLLGRDESPDGEFISGWAMFLELCVKQGVSLSDPRWQQLRIETDKPHTRFTISASGSASPSDEDFKVGLQLLMGMLDDKSHPDI